MVRPKLYLSAVSAELLTAREVVAKTIRTLGFDSVSEDDFRTGQGGLRRWLQRSIDACEGLIQIVGGAYGPEPPQADPDFGRVSYTQLEFLYARRRRKKTWVILAGELIHRDQDVDHLDLPRSTSHADPDGYQAERRQLQRAYLKRLKEEGHLVQRVDSAAELEHVVLGLADDLGKLHERWERRRRWLGVGAVTALAGLLLALGGGWWWWAYDSRSSEVGQAPLIKVDRISERVRQAVEATYRRKLEEAQQAPGAQVRQRRVEAAQAARAARLPRIPELAASLVQVDFSGASTRAFQEMIRILSDEGVDAALAYVAGQRETILRTVRDRPASDWARNRADLETLLKAAALYENQGQPAEARALYQDILRVEPAWSEARHGLLWLLIDQGDVATNRGDLDEALGAYQEAYGLAQRIAAAEPSNARWQRDLSITRTMLGDVALARGQLEDAAAAYQDALPIARQLTARDPANVQAQRDLFYLCFQISHLEAEQERWDAAMTDAESCRAIAEQLVGTDPSNSTLQQDTQAIDAWQRRLRGLAESAER